MRGGAFTPNRQKLIGDFVCMVLVVYRGNGTFQPVAVMFLLFLLNQVLGEVLSSQFEEIQKRECGAPLS